MVLSADGDGGKAKGREGRGKNFHYKMVIDTDYIECEAKRKRGNSDKSLFWQKTYSGSELNVMFLYLGELNRSKSSGTSYLLIF